MSEHRALVMDPNRNSYDGSTMRPLSQCALTKIESVRIKSFLCMVPDQSHDRLHESVTHARQLAGKTIVRDKCNIFLCCCSRYHRQVSAHFLRAVGALAGFENLRFKIYFSRNDQQRCGEQEESAIKDWQKDAFQDAVSQLERTLGPAIVSKSEPKRGSDTTWCAQFCPRKNSTRGEGDQVQQVGLDVC